MSQRPLDARNNIEESISDGAITVLQARKKTAGLSNIQYICFRLDEQVREHPQEQMNNASYTNTATTL